MHAFLDFDFDVFQMGVMQEFVHNVNHVFIYEVCPRGIDQYIGVCRNFFQFSFYNGLIQERYVFPESYQIPVLVIDHQHRGSKVTPDHKEKPHQYTNYNAHQQVCKQDGYDGYSKGNELVPSFMVKLLYQGNFCQLISSEYEDSCQGRQRNFVQDVGDECHAEK